MKNRLALSGHLLLCTCMLLFASPGSAESNTAYVQVRSAVILKEPKHLASILKRCAFGDPLTTISHEADWIRVRMPNNVEGFIHRSALSSQRVSLAGGKNFSGGVSQTDISLAGKGFSPEIEKQLAAKNSTLNFRAVDSMEKINVSAEQTRAFAKTGKLSEKLY